MSRTSKRRSPRGRRVRAFSSLECPIIRFLFVLLLSTCALADGPARVSSLDWLSGTWVHEAADGRATESWVGPERGMMVASNLTVLADGTRIYEFLRIADTQEGFSYYASPNGRAPEEFKLQSLGNRRVVFENAAKEFPHRILYWRDGDALMARIEGTIKGEAKAEEWRFERK